MKNTYLVRVINSDNKIHLEEISVHEWLQILTAFIGNAAEAARFLKKIVCKIRYLDCVVLPSTACFDEDPEMLAEVIEFMACEGVLMYKPNKERLEQLRCAYSGISM